MPINMPALNTTTIPRTAGNRQKNSNQSISGESSGIFWGFNFTARIAPLRQALKRSLRFRSFKQTIDAFESGCAGSGWALLQIDQIFGKPCGFGLSLLIDELPLYGL